MSDAGLWTGASHNDSAAIGCVGCHVGHGSSQHSLLDPDPPAFPAGANPSNFDTDFCINCHDNDGPSAKDIAAQFDTGTDYRVTGMNGELNNQRHDVTYDDQVNYSSSALACNDCHSPHIDNDTDPVRHPDTGAVLPTFAITGSWNGGSYDSGGNSDPSNPEGGGSVTEPDYIQFCLACHDGTPAGNSAGAYDIGSSYVTSRGGKRHGNGDGSTGTGIGKGNLKPPWTTAADYAANQDPVNVYAALNCTTCHGPHGTGNIYSLRESITVAGTPMEIGSDAPAGQFPKPTFSGFTYTLPVDATSGSQTRDIYGAWCTFCHNMNSGHTGVTEQSNCNSGHRHGGNNF
jgi:cytochrome c553